MCTSVKDAHNTQILQQSQQKSTMVNASRLLQCQYSNNCNKYEAQLSKSQFKLIHLSHPLIRKYLLIKTDPNSYKPSAHLYTWFLQELWYYFVK